MDLSTLTKAIAADEVWLDSLSPWLIGASAIVIIGLIIEQWPDFWKLHWRHWDNEKFLELLGGSIVAVFITVELLVTFLASRAETQLRLDNAKYEAALQDEAATANNNAAKANSRAAVLEKEAADERQRAAEIMRATAWRQFRPEQVATLLATLSRMPGKTVLAWVANDSESLGLAYQFSKILDSAHWRFSTSAMTFANALVWGIDVQDGSEAAAESTRTLREALTKAGVGFSTEKPPPTSMSFAATGGPDFAMILFGSKKPTFTQPP